jgi:hypothetical protein
MRFPPVNFSVPSMTPWWTNCPPRQVTFPLMWLLLPSRREPAGAKTLPPTSPSMTTLPLALSGEVELAAEVEDVPRDRAGDAQWSAPEVQVAVLRPLDRSGGGDGGDIAVVGLPLADMDPLE